MTYSNGKQEELAFEPLVAESPYQEGTAPIPEDACYTDSSSCGHLLKWRAVAFRPKTETIWMENGEENSSQWAELQAVWLINTQELSHIVACTGSWAIYQGLTLWLLTWYHANWMVGHQLL